MTWLALLLACRAPAPQATEPAESTVPSPQPTGATGSPATTDSTPTGHTGPTATTGETATPWSGEPTASPYVLRSGPPPRNVLLVSVDTTRFDHLNSNGYTARETSPRIDALLAEGLALRNHRSCSAWTMASFLCLLTGRDQLDLGYWPDNNNHGAGVDPFPYELPSLALRLQQEGFATGLVYANSFLSSTFAMNTGHDTEQRGSRAPGVTDHAIERLDELVGSGERWFLHAHYNDPHNPYDADPTFREGGTDCPVGSFESIEDFKALRAVFDDADPADQAACLEHVNMLYDAGIREADHHIGRLLDHLDTTGQRDDTLIVFATDHGEEFLEHGEWEHGHGLFQAIHRSTVGFVYPPRIAPAQHTGLTTHVDVHPTLLTVLDLEVPTELTGTVVGQETVDHVFGLVYRNELTGQAVTTPSETLIYHWDGRFHHYDDLADPTQASDRYDADDPATQALWQLLEPRVAELAARVTDGSVPQGLP